MNPTTKTAIKKVSMNAAKRINNLYATAYMDVHANAGPWGAKHDDSVSAVIEEEVSKIFMVAFLSRRKKV
jgi:hypothetical protein